MKKKAVVLLLALVLCIGLAIPAFAVETTLSENGLNLILSNEILGTENWSYYDGDKLITETINVVSFETLISWSASEGHDCIVQWFVPATSEESVWEFFCYTFRSADAPVQFEMKAYDENDKYLGTTADYEKCVMVFYHVADNDKRVPIMGVKSYSTPTGPTTETPSSWAVEQVNAAIAAGIVPETFQSKYTTATTRAEFCALAVALYENVTGKIITQRATFDDTKDVNVEKAAAIGVVTGTGNNNFSPDNQLTREQAATMLSRLADAVGKPLAKQAATFADNGSISSWAVEQVGQIQAAGIMGGVGNNTFAPKNDYTREQSIITIMRLFDIVK